MSRKRIIAAILGVVLGSLPQTASAACTPVDVIRQRFVHDGAGTSIVSDPRAVAVITELLKAQNAVPSAISEKYLVIEISGIVVIYSVRDGQICAAGREGIAWLTGPSACDLIKGLREIEQAL